MNGTRLWTALPPALLLALAPLAAHAQGGTIQDIAFSPDPATAGHEVTITILGTGKCKKLSVSLGDESPPAILDNANFDDNNTANNSLTHVYANAGTYSVWAEGVEQCGPPLGEKSSILVEAKTIQLGALPVSTKDYLCAILKNCNQLAASEKIVKSLPELESIYPFSVIEPGGLVLVYGKNFGTSPGKVHLSLKTDNKDVTLQNKEWGNGYMLAKIPISTIGVVDQPAELYVKTATGWETERLGPLNFTAKRGLKLLPRADVSVSATTCGTAADCDRCVASSSSCCEVFEKSCFVTIFSEGSFSGYHWQDCGLIGDDKDTDTYTTVPFKNGWELNHADIYNTVDPGEGSASVSLVKSSNPPKVKVKWSISPCDGIAYKVYVFIKGPAATDYK